MEKGSEPKRGGKRSERHRRGKVTPRVTPETEVLRIAHPTGSQFKGYEPYQVQELELTARVVRYRRERWLTPDGETIVAPLPSGIRGHFGPELRRFVLMQYHQGQVTVERLVGAAAGDRHQHLQAAGDAPADRPAGATSWPRTARCCGAGLQTADWISVDDTGARHRGTNGVCTQIGNDQLRLVRHDRQQEPAELPRACCAPGTRITWSTTRRLAYMRERALAGAAGPASWPRIERAANLPTGRAWDAAGSASGSASPPWRVTPDPVRVATEGALWGAGQCPWVPGGAPRRWWSVTTPGNSTSASTLSVGFTPNAWCTNWRRSLTSSVSPSSMSAG